MNTNIRTRLEQTIEELDAECRALHAQLADMPETLTDERVRLFISIAGCMGNLSGMRYALALIVRHTERS